MKVCAAVIFQQVTKGLNEIRLQALKNAVEGISSLQTLFSTALEGKCKPKWLWCNKAVFFSAYEGEMPKQSLIQAFVSQGERNVTRTRSCP